MRARVVLMAAVLALAIAAPAQAAFPGKNGLIAFDKGKGGPRDIWVIGPKGGKERDITRTRRLNEVEPSFSPNGRTIAFQWFGTGSSLRNGIGIVNSDGTGLRHLSAGTNPDDYYQSPHWAADGKTIVYQRSHNDANGEPVSATWSMPAKGGPQRQITPDHTHAAITSPIGHQLAYLEFNPEGNDFLQLTDANGANPVTVGQQPRMSDFSPDGRRFIYSHKSAIFTRPVDAATPTPVADRGENDLDPAFSPDGRLIVWSNEATHDLWIASSSGGRARNLTHQGGFEKEPSWGKAATAR